VADLISLQKMHVIIITCSRLPRLWPSCCGPFPV
jgi:hypothetical protein